MEHLKNIGTLFYIVNPYESMYEKLSDLPNPDWFTKVNYTLNIYLCTVIWDTSSQKTQICIKDRKMSIDYSKKHNMSLNDTNKIRTK